MSAVDGDADRGDDDHRLADDRFRRGEAPDRLPGDPADRHEQDDRVEQGGENGGTAQAIGVARGRALPGERARRPGDQQRQHVAQIVAGVGEQGDGVADDAIGGFDDDERDVERRANREGAPEAARSVRVSVRMSVAVMVIVMRMHGHLD